MVSKGLADWQTMKNNDQHMNHHTNIITYTWRCPFGVLAVGACRMFSGPKSAEAEIPRSRGGDGT